MRLSIYVVSVTVLLSVFGGRASSASDTSGEVVVGILESSAPEQLESLKRKYSIRSPAVIRIAFKKGSGGWQAFRSDFNDPGQLNAATRFFPTTMDWTIAYRGNPHGRIESASPTRRLSYGDIGIQIISPDQSIPRIGRPDQAFEQFGSSEPVYRPLVVVSHPNTRDPEAWTPTKPEAGVLEAASAVGARQVRPISRSIGG